MSARPVFAALLSATLCALAACADLRGSLTSSASRLERDARVLAENAASEPVRADTPPAEHSYGDYPNSYSRDARVLADDAREFRHTVADRAASDSEVKASFARVSRSYHAVRDEVEHADSSRAREDLRPVTDAYLDVEREMGGYPTRVSQSR